MRLVSAVAVVWCVLALGGCASGPEPSPEPVAVAAAVLPPAWQAPLPHGGQLVALRDWWRQFDDPLLVQLIDAAQAASASLASAASRIEQARATRVAAGAALLPTLDGSASVSRGSPDFVTPLGSVASVGVQAGWELDLFGGRRAARDAAQARVDGAQAAWHDARVSVAAEVAGTYIDLRACEAQLEKADADAASRAETARLTELSRQAGFEAPANAALARASAAQGRSLLAQRRAQCDLQVKALVALTGLAEPPLRQRLAAATARVPQPAQLEVARVPAQALAQRPDLFGAERAWAAAAAEVSQARSQQLPRISLAGSIGAMHAEAGPISASGGVWTLGPVVISMPLFDGGARRANVDAARARYVEAEAQYRGKLRGAVREVEEALIRLQATAERSADARIAADGFADSLRGAQARQQGGLGSLFELEDARRSALQSQSALIDLERERSAAWIALYRALGGGWSPEAAQLAGATASGPIPLR